MTTYILYSSLRINNNFKPRLKPILIIRTTYVMSIKLKQMVKKLQIMNNYTFL